ncbi:hypothetical protein XELAEV_18008692mg [Xenopus laevis]|uniref:G-protein coupled receptors family 3 profile domain-containing protein n=1 Tax=Xenopus laevis TaxID=8355 RepID=A0A974DR66_XENLA|nr:hypothetical protein XELAEV_18008692mg [Xenopus laevis]
MCIYPSAPNYKYLVDILYGNEYINKNPDILGNKTLGYHIYDSCGDPRRAIKSVLQILSGTREPVPNYSCVGKRNIAGFIGDLTSETTLPIAQILSVFGYTQISYGATDPVLSDRFTFPYFFRPVGSDDNYYLVISKIAKYFQWNWVGIILFDDERGERDLQLLKYYLSIENICIEFTLKMTGVRHWNIEDQEILKQSSTNVIIFCGAVNIEIALHMTLLFDTLSEKTVLVTFNWLHYHHVLDFGNKWFQGSLLIMQNKGDYPSDSPYVPFSNQFHPSKFPDDKLLENIWMHYHLCLTKNPQKNELFETVFKKNLHNCSGQESLSQIQMFVNGFHTLNMMLAVDMLASALQYMRTSLTMETSATNREMFHYRYKVHRYLKGIYTGTDKHQGYYLDEDGEYVSPYVIINTYGNSEKKNAWKIFGVYIPWAPAHQQLKIEEGHIQWKTKDNKVVKFGVIASECIGYIFRVVESFIIVYTETCIRCPYNEWPNEKKNQCIAKIEEFLPYSTDVIPVFFSGTSVFLLLITVMILGVFISNWDTPIVRANNRSLSFLLLVSIKLSFLSVFLFLGRPVDITCMLRNITFGITFSIAVSSLLAKTIMVCVAFKATKPGSSWRKWVGVKLSNSVVLFCSSIQIIICMTWLAISPPFQELDLHTYPGTIIIQCNEGSAIGFYSVIGYMGLLAAVSFVLAFLARTLPDSFNEAKYITFSMLLFCSVWITMIPAYLSTKGKNTVCVEIFAILTSSAGLLASIFLPKCYIILFRQERNKKSHLLLIKT